MLPTRVPPLWVYVVLLVAVVLAAYGGGAGRGFIKEDATWVMRSRIAQPSDALRALSVTGGFFRPAVSFSFAINHWMFGSRPRGYGWTNLLLALGAAAALYAFGRTLGLRSGAAMVASAVWILNFHGINMAVLWMSGRTALLLTLFALLAAIATARGRLAAACIWTLLALASKEEAVLLPFALVAILWLRPEGWPGRRRTAAFVVALAVVLSVYALLRSRSDAMTASTAPTFYSLMSSSWSPARNLGEYADRALTFPVAVAVLALTIAGRRPTLDRMSRRLILLGAIWLACGFAVTILLTIRSSLYAVFPSVGSALACAVVVSAGWDAAPHGRRRAMAVVALLLPPLFLPVYWQRNVRWTELADLSRQLVVEFEDLARTAPAGWEVIVLDDRSTRATVAAAVGCCIPDAVELTAGKRPRVWIVPPPPDLPEAERVIAPSPAQAIVALREGRFVRVPVEGWTPRAAGVVY
jgi:hypothetical protein